ncbi:MAG TPA: polysaccharide deacetylase family protein, partial [Reyranella sp.]
MSTSLSIPGPVRDLVGYNGKPPKVTWPGGARIAISLVVNYEEGSELAVGDGDGLTERGLSESAVRPWPDGKRDLAMETMYEYGARSGFWRLMDIFDELEVKSTFYVCAVALERNRKAAREIRGRGHDVVCHGY